MPELPEVETIRTQLSAYLPIEIKSTSYSKVSSSILKQKDFSPKGRTITQILRKGKVLNFHLSNNGHIISHLGMSGTWRVSREKLNEKHNHI